MPSEVPGVFEWEGASPAPKGVCFSAQLLLSTWKMGSLHCGLNHHTQSSLLSLTPPLPLEILTLSHLDAVEMRRAATPQTVAGQPRACHSYLRGLGPSMVRR